MIVSGQKFLIWNSKLFIVEIERLHHIAIICSDYAKSKFFYTEILKLSAIREVYREDSDSYKLDLALNGQYIIELFSFPNPPSRATGPEATGLRHLAFGVKDITKEINYLNSRGITAEPIRVDEYTGKRFTFFRDPDDLPIEIYEL